MVSYSFRQENYEKWLAGYAAALNTPVRDNVLSFPAHLGEGTFLAQDISAHLSCLLLDLRPEKDLEFVRESEGRQGFSLSFSESLPTGANIPGNDIHLTDTRDSLQVKIPAGTRFQRLVLFCSDELIRHYVPDELMTQLEIFAREGNGSANKYAISFVHREALKEIFDLDANDPLNRFRRVALIFRLIEIFLQSFMRRERDPLPRRLKKNDLESMRHIERILSSQLEGFPSLESLAQEVFMSTSKLKTLFKQVYGYTLYDYYNKSRLLRAKEMLVTGQYSIKQAGCEIGFSNLSHFAKAFKKEYGVLPREIVRTR